MGLEGQGREGREADGVDVGAGAGHDELRDGAVRELRGAAREEGGRRRDLLLQGAVVAVLLALLADDGADDGDQGRLVAAVGGEDGLRGGQHAEDDVGEGLGEGDGIVEGGDGEVVLAGLDGGLVCVGEDTVCREDMELFLLGRMSVEVAQGGRREAYIDDGRESLNRVAVVASLVAGNAGCDVVEELREVCDFEELVGGNELESLDTIGLQAGRWSAVWSGSAGELEDLLQGCRVEVGKAIGQWVREGCGSSNTGRRQKEVESRRTHGDGLRDECKILLQADGTMEKRKINWGT